MNDPVVQWGRRWTDILPPSPPPSISLWLVVGAVLLFVLVALVVFFLWRRQPRQCALRRLRQCRAQLQQADVDTHALAGHCYRAVLQGLRATPASIAQTVPAADTHWQAFYYDLQRCVFQAPPPRVDELTRLIEQARRWLRQH
ncbi:MAG: DUF4381 family protein [Gammaproteobacteria bacterium]|nr:DUF4381 family protein [Gammaproteobacteria bacterium]